MADIKVKADEVKDKDSDKLYAAISAILKTVATAQIIAIFGVADPLKLPASKLPPPEVVQRKLEALRVKNAKVFSENVEEVDNAVLEINKNFSRKLKRKVLRSVNRKLRRKSQALIGYEKNEVDVPRLPVKLNEKSTISTMRKNKRIVKKGRETVILLGRSSNTSTEVDLLKQKSLDYIRLIQSATDDNEKKLLQLVSDYRSGKYTASTLAEEIRNVVDVTETRAKLIARDQTNKIVSLTNQIEAKKMGVGRYTWRTSGDGNVRSSHDKLNGREFEWDKPPSVGHPGEDIQCRCTPEFIIEV